MLTLFSALIFNSIVLNSAFAANDDITSAKNAIIFGPKENPKGIITVFTDIDCGYCRKLHNEISRLNDLGIQVRYLAFPRQGIGSSSYTKIVSVWCAKDPINAMNQAMSGEETTYNTCENPVFDHLLLGRKLKIMGTPTIIFTDGTKWPGFAPADKIAEEAILTKQVSGQ